MKRLLTLLFFLCSFNTHANSSLVSIENAWFKPSLITNNDEVICNSLLEGYQDYFSGSLEDNPLEAQFYAREKAARFMLPIATLKNIPWRTLPSEAELRIAEFNIGDNYHALIRHNYSIGWRGGYHYEIFIDKPFTELGIETIKLRKYFDDHHLLQLKQTGDVFKLVSKNQPDYKYRDKNIRITPVNTYSDGSDTYILFSVSRPDQRQTQGQRYGLYKFRSDASLSHVCELKTRPSNEELAEAKNSIPLMDEYLGSMSVVMGGSGNCGTLNAPTRARNAMNKAALSFLYRPWSISGPMVSRYDSFETGRSRMEENLALWGFSGIWNYRKYMRFREISGRTVSSLADFYSKNYGLDSFSATALAEQSITGILLSAFDHGRVNEKHHSIHKLILNGIHASALEFIPLPEDIDTIQGYGAGGQDSILSFAINQSSLIPVLIAKGVDPNKGNPFNKTALMYAAQFNDIDTARQLLNHGAATEIATTKPPDRCGYTLQTNAATAMHYAVRYASLEFIELLLEHGASTNARDSNGYTALDYLTKFGGFIGRSSNEQEVSYGKTNEYLNTEDYKKLQKLLASPENPSKYAKQRNLKGEKFYANGNYARAFSEFRKALEIDDSNPRILNNFALMAYKIKRYGEAAMHADKVIQLKAGDSELAAAYFNMGLICQNFSPWKYPNLSHDNRTYCNSSPLHYYLQSYKIKPSDRKLTRIRDFFNVRSGRSLSCPARSNDGEIQFIHIFRNKYVYVMTSPDVDTDNLTFKHVSKYSLELKDVESFPSNGREYILNNRVKIKEIEIPRTNYITSGKRPVIVNGNVCSSLYPTLIDEEAKIVVVKASSSAPANIEIIFETDQKIIPVLYGEGGWQFDIKDEGNIYTPYVIGPNKGAKDNEHLLMLENDSFWRRDSRRLDQGFRSEIFLRMAKLADIFIQVNHSSKVIITESHIKRTSESIRKPPVFLQYD